LKKSVGGLWVKKKTAQKGCQGALKTKASQNTQQNREFKRNGCRKMWNQGKNKEGFVRGSATRARGQITCAFRDRGEPRLTGQAQPPRW